MASDLKRRAFLGRIGAVGVAAAAAGVLTKVAAHEASTVPELAPRASSTPDMDGVVTVTAAAPLVIDGSADFGAIHLDGGHITTSGGGIVNIRHLRKA